jgi:hypothetical protein
MEMPSTTSTACVRTGGTASGRPAMAAMPVAIMAPVINPPGRCAHKNSSPPTVPMPSVSSAARILERVGKEPKDAVICFTRLYRKSAASLPML